MLLEKNEVVEVVEEKVVYKIIVSYLYNGEARFKYSLDLKGKRHGATSMVEGIIDYKPTQNEIDKAIELAKKDNNVSYEMNTYECKIEVKKVKIKKLKKVITKIEEIITFEKEWEDA